MEWKDDGRRWGSSQKGLQFPVVWPEGLAFRNTTGKSFSVVSLTRLACLILLTCKSFLWVLSGVYSCFDLTVSAMTLTSLWQHESLWSGYSLRSLWSDKLPEARNVALINHVRSAQSDLNTSLTKDFKVTAAWAATRSTTTGPSGSRILHLNS